MLDLTEKTIQSMDFQEIPLTKNTSLLAFAGWYDYSFFPQKSFAQHLKFKNTIWFDRRLKRDQSDPQITQEVLERLEKQLLAITNKNIIVAMHFVLHRDYLLTYHKLLPFNAFLGSQAFHELFKTYGVKQVIFGHNHRRNQARTIDGITYYSKPLGYQKEWQMIAEFTKRHPELSLKDRHNPNKRYAQVKQLPDFKQFRLQELQNEFKSAMTVIDIEIES